MFHSFCELCAHLHSVSFIQEGMICPVIESHFVAGQSIRNLCFPYVAAFYLGVFFFNYILGVVHSMTVRSQSHPDWWTSFYHLEIEIKKKKIVTMGSCVFLSMISEIVLPLI